SPSPPRPLNRKADLGRRMNRAFRAAFREGCTRVIIVGSDCPGLSAGHIAEAFALLDACDVVLGPARDGGYYLIALSRPAPSIFGGIEWGTENVLAQQIHRIQSAGLTCKTLETLDDIDRP